MGDSVKEAVKIREKKLKNGNISLYLDIYHGGKRTYEFLRVYLKEKPVTKADKEHNSEQISFANAVKSRRIVEIKNREYGFRSDKTSRLVIPFFKEVLNSKSVGGTLDTWNATIRLLEKYVDPQTTFKEVDRSFVVGFLNFIKNHKKTTKQPLAPNTIVVYYSKFTECMREAVRQDILQKDPTFDVKGPKSIEPQVNYINFEEIKILLNTPCNNELLKRAFLFSCLTGLRNSDIVKLNWGMIQKSKTSTRITFKQKKTLGQEYLDINPQASELMGDRKSDNEQVFQGFKYSTSYNITLKNWIKSAGINRRLTFHSARHSFAILMIELGIDLYTVSKLVGHREIGSTQRYAKVMDKNKLDAVNKIPSLTD